MRFYYPNDLATRRAVRNKKKPRSHPSHRSATRHLLLGSSILACTLRPVEALSFDSIWIFILTFICQLPFLNWFSFCSNEGRCTGDDINDICQIPTEYCSKPSCLDKSLGICTPRPQFCPFNYNPVCGCNYQTYANDCARQAAGVNKRSDGPCGSFRRQGQPCSSANGSSNDAGCAVNEFCDLQLSSCHTAMNDAVGECVLVEEYACPAVYAPVCGCNGQTYENDCLRIRARVNKASTGLCPGAHCQTAEGCFNDAVYCDRLGNCSATMGQCVAVPNACPDELEQPVCGCDNRTYMHDCERKIERVSLQKEGVC